MQVLTVPRTELRDYEGFVSWADIGQRMGAAFSKASWVQRSVAERSADLLQLIPCGVLADEAGRLCVLRRIPEGRADLRSRVSLVSGGHVEPISRASALTPTRGTMVLLRRTLARELDEELSVAIDVQGDPIGIVSDAGSLEASRHLGVVFVIPVTPDTLVSIAATEEFSLRSKLSGQYFAPKDLLQKSIKLDPWSAILLTDVFLPRSGVNSERQKKLSLY